MRLLADQLPLTGEVVMVSAPDLTVLGVLSLKRQPFKRANEAQKK